jgi:hypothetical protein
MVSERSGILLNLKFFRVMYNGANFDPFRGSAARRLAPGLRIER